jgi:restriction system protein
MDISSIVIVGIVILIVALWACVRSKVPHQWRIRKAYKVLARLREMEQKGRGYQFGFLRSAYVDPYTFEETILTSFLKRKVRIQRNRRYSGDGGIDGRIWVGGQLVLIQAKRYSNHINPKHVVEFDSLCNRHKAFGVFIHTGRTGEGSKEALTARLDIVSGDRLINLLMGLPFELRFGLQKFSIQSGE